MKRWLWFALLVAMSALPAVAHAGSHIGFGVALDGFFPYDPEMYGERMVHNSWGKDMFGKGWSHGEDRVEFDTPNRYGMIFSPAFTETYFWDWGLGIELTEQIQYLFFSPNKDVDITFDRFMFPLKLTFKWTFLNNGKVRPFVGAGASYNYTVTHIGGKDLYDQVRNPKYSQESADQTDSGSTDDEDRRATQSDEREFFTTQRDWGVSGWYPGFHGTAGLNVMLTSDLALAFALRYEVLLVESFDVERVSDADGQWHWIRHKLVGDAGGFGASIGVMYSF